MLKLGCFWKKPTCKIDENVSMNTPTEARYGHNIAPTPALVFVSPECNALQDLITQIQIVRSYLCDLGDLQVMKQPFSV